MNNPRGLALDSSGALYVAEAGKGGTGKCVKAPEAEGTACLGPTGSITRIWNGQQERIVTGLPSVADKNGMSATGPSSISISHNGNIYATVQGPDSQTPKTFGFAGAHLWHLI